MDEPRDRESSPIVDFNLVLVVLVVLVLVGGSLAFLFTRRAYQARELALRHEAEARLYQARVAEEALRIHERKRLAGSWILVGGEKEGLKFTPDQITEGRLTIDDSRMSVIAANLKSEGPYRLHLDTKLHGIDLQGGPDATFSESFRGVYELKGEHLRLNFSNPGGDRPAKLNDGPLRTIWKRAPGQ